MSPFQHYVALTTISPQLYFVKVDVQACFDTIEQSKLLKILKALISEVCFNIILTLHLQYLLCCLGGLYDT